MDKNWPRWMRASVIDYFKTFIQDQNELTVYIETTEHVDKDGNYITQLDRWAEARFNGPICRPITATSFENTITVNFIVATKLDQVNAYTHDDNVGIVFSAFVNSISVFKFGTGPDDDQSFFGCFQLVANKKDAIMVSHFGQIDTDVKLTQSTVEAHYCMHLDL